VRALQHSLAALQNILASNILATVNHAHKDTVAATCKAEGPSFVAAPRTLTIGLASRCDPVEQTFNVTRRRRYG
jgi:hypothetical protein